MVHLFQRAGLLLALDTGSGAVHVLDVVSYDLLQSLPQDAFLTEEPTPFAVEPLAQLATRHGEDQTAGALQELRALAGQGLLYSDDGYESFQAALGPAPVKAMCLHIAHDCNLRCRYCFASTGGFGGERKLMPFSVAKQAIDQLIALSEGRRNLEVDFFGGEPLMNMEVVRQTVAYARSVEQKHGKNFRFTLTTNGLALNDATCDFINAEMSNVVLSVDGRREVNDRMRPCIDGRGSFDTIVPKYQKLVAGRAGKEYYVRGTYTRHNLDFDQDVLALSQLGFDQISVEPVVGPETDEYAIREEDITKIEQSYERLMHEMLVRSEKKENEFNFFHFMLDLDNGPCAIKRLKGCGSGNEYMAVTPDGEFYPCHQFVGNPAFRMGTVEEGITRADLKNCFANANLFNKPTCGGCWAKYFCSGGCNANNHNFRGSIYEPYVLSCTLEKIRLECAIALKAAEALQTKIQTNNPRIHFN